VAVIGSAGVEDLNRAVRKKFRRWLDRMTKCVDHDTKKRASDSEPETRFVSFKLQLPVLD